MFFFQPECRVCGKPLEGRQQDYCSKKCKGIGEGRREKGYAENIRPRRSHLEWTDEDIQDRINTKSDKITYIGGYRNCQEPIYVMCNDCGTTFKYSGAGLRRKKAIRCSNCEKILSEAKEQEYQKHLKETIDRRRLLQELKEKELKQKRTHICVRCGKEFTGRGKKYCSKVCHRRQMDSDKEHTRRMRAMSRTHDSISLQVLSKRDKGICWICGQKVDWYDYKKRDDGCFIAQDNYPSIDHVMPLAKGGMHTWDNVRLAHRKCNTIKQDSLIIKDKNEQFRLAI